MYLKLGETFRFPVLPEKVTVSNGSSNDKLKVCGVGEVTIIQESSASGIQFSSFFPKHYFDGCNYRDIPSPNRAVDIIKGMMASKKPIRFTISGGIGVSMYCTIESFEISEEGGDVGTIYFSLKLKEYREANIRQINVSAFSGKAKVATTNSRTDNSTVSSPYTVKSGDCLWNIAKKSYGNGSKYTSIYNANKAIIGGNSNLIRQGQVLTIPTV